MKFSSISTVAGLLLLPFCKAQNPYSLDPLAPGYIGNNITLSFLLQSDPKACANGAGTPTRAIGFTTNSYSEYPYCFNIDELFAENSSTTGVGRFPAAASTSDILPFLNGWNYTLLNRGAYQPGDSFGGVYVESTNTTFDGVENVGQGKAAGRQVTFYTRNDCRTLFSNYTATSYTLSCQTAAGGECHQTEPIRSFRLMTRASNLQFPNPDTGCKAFTQFNAATSRSVATGLAIGVSSVIALWLAL
jgi:hypothetical protein